MKRYALFILLQLFGLLPSIFWAVEHDPVKMQVRRLLVDPMSKAPVVILESIPDKKILPIWIGPAEATSIAQELEQVRSPRPNSHDLIQNILRSLGATLNRITINDLRNNTYYATITLKMQNQDFQIDSRPSDAIAVALRMKASIFAAPQVLAKASLSPLTPEQQKEGLKETMGIHFQDLTPELAGLLESPGTQGVLVADVDWGSPAMEAGLARGDVIIRVNNQSVQKASQADSALKAVKKPARVKLELLRKGKLTTVVLDFRP